MKLIREKFAKMVVILTNWCQQVNYFNFMISNICEYIIKEKGKNWAYT